MSGDLPRGHPSSLPRDNHRVRTLAFSDDAVKAGPEQMTILQAFVFQTQLAQANHLLIVAVRSEASVWICALMKAGQSYKMLNTNLRNFSALTRSLASILSKTLTRPYLRNFDISLGRMYLIA